MRTRTNTAGVILSISSVIVIVLMLFSDTIVTTAQNHNCPCPCGAPVPAITGPITVFGPTPGVAPARSIVAPTWKMMQFTPTELATLTTAYASVASSASPGSHIDVSVAKDNTIRFTADTHPTESTSTITNSTVLKLKVGQTITPILVVPKGSSYQALLNRADPQ
jgi:hypothetical protein